MTSQFENESSHQSSHPSLQLAAVNDKEVLSYKKIKNILQRYGMPIDEMEIQYVKDFLKEDILTLKNVDAFIGLREYLQKRKIESVKPLAEDNVYVGAYKLFNPTLKDLNDKWLGPIATDDFMNELHEEIKKIDTMNILQNFFKGGNFLMDLSQVENIIEIGILDIQRNLETEGKSADNIFSNNSKEI